LLAWAALAVVLAGCSTPMRVDVSRLARSTLRQRLLGLQLLLHGVQA